MDNFITVPDVVSFPKNQEVSVGTSMETKVTSPSDQTRTVPIHFHNGFDSDKISFPDVVGVPIVAKGDLFVFGTKADKLSLGTNGQYLTVNTSTYTGLEWVTLPAIPDVPLTTKGDLLGFSTVNDRVPVGTDGQVLTADSAEATGVAWADVVGMPTGAIIPYPHYYYRTLPSGYLAADGSAVSRTTYADLFDVLVTNMGTMTVTIASPAVLSVTSSNFRPGDQVYFTTTGALPTGLSANTIYYVISAGLGATIFEVSTTRGGAAVNTSGSQSGVHTCFLCPFGLGDGSTTFNVPDMQQKVVVGLKVTDADMGYMGQTGGEKTHVLTTTEMPSHTHTFGRDGGGGAFGFVSNNNTGTTTTTSSSTGSDGAHNNLQPYMTMQYIIKT